MSQLLVETMCLPPIPVMHAIVRHSGVIWEAHEHYQKRSFRNRICLLGPQGIERFTIPLEKGKNQQKSIREVTISYSENWPLQLSKLIHSNYGSAPYFTFYFDELYQIISQKWTKLWDLNTALFDWISDCLQLNIPILMTEAYQKKVSLDVVDKRGAYLPNKHFFERPPVVSYEQVFSYKHGIIGNLSILDLLLCCGPEARTKLMS